MIYILLLISWKHSPNYAAGGVYNVKQSQGTNWIVVGTTTNNVIQVKVELRKSDLHVTYSNASGESVPSNTIPMPQLFDMVIPDTNKTAVITSP